MRCYASIDNMILGAKYIDFYCWLLHKWVTSKITDPLNKSKPYWTTPSRKCKSTRKMANTSMQKIWGWPPNSSKKIWRLAESMRWTFAISSKTTTSQGPTNKSWKLSTTFGTKRPLITTRKERNWLEICRPGTRPSLITWEMIWKNSCLIRSRRARSFWTWKKWNNTWPSKKCKKS